MHQEWYIIPIKCLDRAFEWLEGAINFITNLNKSNFIAFAILYGLIPIYLFVYKLIHQTNRTIMLCLSLIKFSENKAKKKCCHPEFGAVSQKPQQLQKSFSCVYSTKLRGFCIIGIKCSALFVLYVYLYILSITASLSLIQHMNSVSFNVFVNVRMIFVWILSLSRARFAHRERQRIWLTLLYIEHSPRT